MKFFIIIFIFIFSVNSKFAIGETFICNLKTFAFKGIQDEFKLIIEYKKNQSGVKAFKFYDFIKNRDMTTELFGAELGIRVTKGIGSVRVLKRNYDKNTTFFVSKFWEGQTKPYTGTDLIGFYFMPEHALTVNTLIVKYDPVNNSNKYEIEMFKSSRTGSSPFHKGLCEVFSNSSMIYCAICPQDQGYVEGTSSYSIRFKLAQSITNTQPILTT